MRRAALAEPIIGPKRFDPAFDSSVDSLAVTTTELIILHLFSGHRRQGDMQCQVDDSSFVGKCKIFVLSIDLAISGRCDVSKLEVRTFWLGQCQSGRVISAEAGPPCESFVAVRSYDDDGPPSIEGCL